MHKNKMIRHAALLLTLLLMIMAVPAAASAAEAPVNLGSTAGFAVLAGTTITNTGPTTIGGSVGGDIGVSPGTAITGFPPGILSDGIIHSADATALQAQADLVIAYDDAASRALTADLTGQDLGGLTLTTGVYKFSSSAQLTGTLILDAEGDPEAVFIFQISSTLTTASGSTVSLINGARFCRIFWQVGSSATLGTNTTFVGHVFALTSIAAQTGATVQGQLLARNGEVTLDNNTITNGVCEAVPSPTPTATESSAAETTGATSAAETTGVTSAIDDELPTTGESGNATTSIIIGLILLGLAASLTFYLRRSRSR
ncbi:MAG TPA: hypothetical protein DD640_07845 [Clostridiales bacterium]|nr:hypothetical protein [Clostridiales bacterium]